MDRIIEELDHGWWVASHEQKLWLPEGELPYSETVNSDLVDQCALQIDEWQGEPAWLVQLQGRHNMGSVRQIINLDIGLFQLAGHGMQLAEFCGSHKYCGYYGREMYPSRTEGAMLCGHYHEHYYPQAAPCIIVAIRRDDSILFAQHTHHHNGTRTVLAGFIEVGEAFEQTVAQEMMEESGIKVKNLRYVASRPWPLPQSLMTAFMTEYDSGGIVIDPKELLEAHWYRCDDLPLLPPSSTVARRLVEDAVAMCRTEYEG